MDWKQYLTEKILNSCWHEEFAHYSYKDQGYYCPRCKTYLPNSKAICPHRTFTTIQDLHDVYSAVEREERWEGVYTYLWNHKPDNLSSFTSWLFCLNGSPEDFLARCKMVAEWHGWKEAGDETV